VGSAEAVWLSGAALKTDRALGEGARRSAEGGRVQTGGRFPCLDEVLEDPEDLRRIRDDGDDLHGAVTAVTAERVGVVDLLYQACPCGAALLARDGQLGLVLLGRADMDRRLRLVVALPSLRSEADEVRLARPGAAGARGVQAVAANQMGPSVREVLSNLSRMPM
jgi:hypothetical protein